MKFLILLVLFLSGVLAAPSQNAKAPSQKIELSEDKSSASSKPLPTEPPKSVDIEQNNKNDQSGSNVKPQDKPEKPAEALTLPQIQIMPLPGGLNQQIPSLPYPVQQFLIAVIKPVLANLNKTQAAINGNHPNNFYTTSPEFGHYPPGMFHPDQGMRPVPNFPPFPEPHPFQFGPESGFAPFGHSEEHDIVEITIPDDGPFDGPPPPAHPSLAHPLPYQGQSQLAGSPQGSGPFQPPGSLPLPAPTPLNPSSMIYLPAIVAPQHSAYGQQTQATLVYFPASIAPNNNLPYYPQSYPSFGSFPSYGGGGSSGFSPPPVQFPGAAPAPPQHPGLSVQIQPHALSNLLG